MPFVAVPSTIKVSWFYTLNGIPAMNRLYVSTVPSLPTLADCAAAAAVGATWWDANCKALQAGTLALRAVEAVSVAVQNGPQSTFSAGLPVSGTNGSPALPGNNSFAISLRSGLTGRSARGRWFWAGLSESQVTDNTVAAGTVTSIVAALDNLLSAFAAASLTPIIVSFVSNGIPRPGGPVKFIITDALAVDAIIDSQRGRLH